MFDRIVVGLDGSEASDAATAIAGRLAGLGPGRLSLVSVAEELPPYVSARREAESDREAARAYYATVQRAASARLQRRGVRADTETRYGNEAGGLLGAALDGDADLIVVGHAGHSGVWGAGLGATTGRVVQGAVASVLVARPGAADVAHLVVGYDGSPGAARAVEVAAGLVAATGASLTIGAAPEVAREGDARRGIERLRERLAGDARWRVVPIRGDPAGALVALARDADHGLVLVGAHGARRPWAPGVGPVAWQVLEHAPRNVLVVRLPAGALTAGRLMRRRPVSVSPESPLGTAAQRLLRLGVKCLPVVDGEGRPIGILTLGDLLRRARFGIRHSLADALSEEEIAGQVARLLSTSSSCADVMTREVATVRPAAAVADLLGQMVRRSVKRLLVVDDDGRLIGIVSRSDVLRALAGSAESHDVATRRAVTGRTIAEVMRPVVVSVRPDASAEEVARAVLGSGVGRVAVVDDAGRIAGVVAVRDLLQLASAEARGQLIEMLADASTRLEPLLAQLGRHADTPPTAARLMRREVVTLDPSASLAEALRTMMSRGLKRILVVGPGDRLLGVIDRADVVAALAQAGGHPS